MRFYRFSQKTAIKRGENQYRQRVLSGLSWHILELGAPDGTNFPRYPATVTEVIAVEPEPRFRAQAERAARDAPVPIQAVAGTAASLPAEDGSIDALLASLVLCTVPNPAATLAAAQRVLRPAGELHFYEHVHADHHPCAASSRSRIARGSAADRGRLRSDPRHAGSNQVRPLRGFVAA